MNDDLKKSLSHVWEPLMTKAMISGDFYADGIIIINAIPVSVRGSPFSGNEKSFVIGYFANICPTLEEMFKERRVINVKLLWMKGEALSFKNQFPISESKSYFNGLETWTVSFRFACIVSKVAHRLYHWIRSQMFVPKDKHPSCLISHSQESRKHLSSCSRLQQTQIPAQKPSSHCQR